MERRLVARRELERVRRSAVVRSLHIERGTTLGSELVGD